MKHASLFSGIGGPDLAAEWMGWENVFHCEINPFGQKILKYHFPNSISYENITTTDFTIHRGEVDILTGGFPCQPFSHAGNRQGVEDDRYLWPEMLRAISEIRPTWVVGENVAGIRSMGIEQGYSTLESNEAASIQEVMVIEEIRKGLEEIGYDLQPFIIPACAVNAPHRRDRVWFVAYSNDDGRSENTERGQCKNFENRNQHECLHLHEIATHTDISTERPSRKSNKAKRGGSKNNDEQKGGREQAEQHSGCDDVLRYDANTDHKRLEGIGKSIRTHKERRKAENGSAKQYTCDDRRTLLATGWENFPTQSPVCNGDDGISSRLDSITFPKWRNESIKAGGNAIVPQVIYQIFKAIQQFEDIRPDYFLNKKHDKL